MGITQSGPIPWVDVETSGLDPNKDLLLEVALVITSATLEVIGEWEWLVKWPADVLEQHINGCHPKVFEMHEKNGLWRELLAGNGCELPDLANEMSAALKEYCVGVSEDGRPYFPPLVGSSVSFDRGFLKAHLPTVEKLLSYRHIDVSTIKELVARFYGPAQHYRSEGKARHRGLADIHESINELKWYKAHVFSPYSRVESVGTQPTHLSQNATNAWHSA